MVKMTKNAIKTGNFCFVIILLEIDVYFGVDFVAVFIFYTGKNRVVSPVANIDTVPNIVPRGPMPLTTNKIKITFDIDAFLQFKNFNMVNKFCLKFTRDNYVH